jgi:hypothetical protein
MELSLRRLAAPPERGGPGGVEFLADSDAVSGVEEGSVGGCLVASGLREAHPETTARMETTKIVKSANLKEAISRVAHPRLGRAVGSIRELHCWPNCCGGIAAFTGGP